METKCITILSADRAWTEDNGKIGIAGIFENFNLNKFPAQVMPFSVYIRLENVNKGKNNIVLDFIQESTDNIIATVTAELELPADQKFLQIHAPIPPIILPTSGIYYFILKYNNQIIGKHSINAIIVNGVN